MRTLAGLSIGFGAGLLAALVHPALAFPFLVVGAIFVANEVVNQ